MIPTLVARPADARAVAVICHPHPDMGGDMHSPVVTALHDGLTAAGCATVRFDFRGSVAPHRDLDEACESAADAAPDLPLVLAGYSFGADTVATAEIADAIGELLVAPPFAVFGDRPVAHPQRRRTIIAGGHDQFVPLEPLRQRVDAFGATTLVEVPSTDHFFSGAMQVVRDTATATLNDWLT